MSQRVLRGLHLCFGGPIYRISGASGRYFTFEMHPYHGPLRVHGQTGEPIAHGIFPDRSPFWESYEAWDAAGRHVDAQGRCVLRHPVARKA